MLMHFKRICLVIDKLLLNINFEVFELQPLKAFKLLYVFKD
jgi:hypothetical protein